MKWIKLVEKCNCCNDDSTDGDDNTALRVRDRVYVSLRV